MHTSWRKAPNNLSGSYNIWFYGGGFIWIEMLGSSWWIMEVEEGTKSNETAETVNTGGGWLEHQL